MNILKTILSSLTSLLLLACVTESRAESLNLSVLHQFTAGNNDGASPYSELTQGADGVLYGTTWSGGTNASGVVFGINTDGSDFTLLHHFGSPADGSTPFDGVIQATDGFLYGTTYYGGTNSNGTIFKVNTNGSAYSVIYRFTNSPDGANPYGGLVQGADGALYGTTYAGGSGRGTVFKINISGQGSGYSVLHSFTNFTDATAPFSRLVQGSNGMLYGTTYSGGTSFIGAVFQIDTNGANYSVLHSFNGSPDGFSLQCGLLLGQDGSLYGTTISGGGSGYGTIFKLNTNGAFSVLRSFTNSPDGAHGYARVAQGNDGFLYGVTSAGGTTNAGTIFRVNTNGANYSVLHNFNGNGDGRDPMAGLFTTGNGVFYGTALMGGSTNAGFGTIYRLAIVPTLSLNFSAQPPPSLTISGFPGQQFQIQVSTNLVDWNILTNLSLTNGTAQLYDPISSNSPTRFYRALIP
jgi:uncharacterized repeat protein (TIGR03803 family)